MKTKIYALREINYIRYVGKTCETLVQRLSRHLGGVRRGEKTHKANWIRQMLLRGEIPRITLLEEVEGNGCADEIAWIKFFRDGGVNLTNTTKGGDGLALTPEARAILTQHMRSPEVREKCRVASTAYWASQEGLQTRAFIAEKSRVLFKDPEFKLQHRQAVKKSLQSPAVRAKISKAARGHICTPEERMNRSIAQTGTKQSHAHRDAESKAHMGQCRPCTEEARRNIRAGVTRYYQNKRLKKLI